jgi:hypothetical protein
MKDVTSTSFGLVIAFLLPGLLALYALTYFSDTARATFFAFQGTTSDLGLFLLTILAGLGMGLEVTAVRWVVFEEFRRKKSKLDSDLFSQLSDDKKLTAFRAAVDEHYRYHQFWGGIFVVFPLLCWGWFRMPIHRNLLGFGEPVSWIVFGVWVLTGAAAFNAYSRYMKRTKKILE